MPLTHPSLFLTPKDRERVYTLISKSSQVKKSLINYLLITSVYFFVEEDSNWSNDPIPETDSTPHINVGPQFQCTIPPLSSIPDRTSSEPTHEDLLWDPGINGCSDSEGKHDNSFQIIKAKFSIGS